METTQCGLVLRPGELWRARLAMLPVQWSECQTGGGGTVMPGRHHCRITLIMKRYSGAGTCCGAARPANCYPTPPQQQQRNTTGSPRLTQQSLSSQPARPGLTATTRPSPVAEHRPVTLDRHSGREQAQPGRQCGCSG